MGLRERKRPNLYSDFLREGIRIMGVVFNDEFMSPSTRCISKRLCEVSRSIHDCSVRRNRLRNYPRVFVDANNGSVGVIGRRRARSCSLGITKNFFHSVLHGLLKRGVFDR